jgi:HlyD family secretion protein
MVSTIHSNAETDHLKTDNLSTTLHTLKTDELLPPINRWTFIGGFILVGAISIATAISAVTKYNVSVKANATFRPAGELRIVQSQVEGTIKTINVKENQVVRQGEPIASLDDAKLQSQKSQLLGSIQQNQLQINQLDVQIRFMNSQILAESQSSDRAVAAIAAEIARNQRDYADRQQTTQADFQEAEAALELAKDGVERYRQLAEQGVVSQIQFKEKESAFRTAQIRLERAKAPLNPLNAAVAISQAQSAQETAKGAAALASLNKEREALVQRQSEIQNQIIRDRKELEQVERDLARSVIRATSDGIVFKLNLLNPSQVIHPGDRVAQIAPSQAPLVIKAKVANQDIDNVAVGQAVQVQVSACPYTDYGILQGTVTAIAPDTGSEDAGLQNSSSQTSDSQSSSTQNSGGANRSFEVVIQPHQFALGRGDRQCRLQPGMEGRASIISKEETFLQFVLRKARLLADV